MRRKISSRKNAKKSEKNDGESFCEEPREHMNICQQEIEDNLYDFGMTECDYGKQACGGGYPYILLNKKTDHLEFNLIVTLERYTKCGYLSLCHNLHDSEQITECIAKK
ncbi:hypothetical protein BpHYR1_011087 [Brachionus plicatilis]|uniref:Uncharacterized protein n=1 Tax=Brachionus plicatilis TaxID=10195 RepID=A0A3M7RYN0_BRAPC|nr:hypothetical protein BpHYR1_011087 [Brachionus plicatilis]